jgi:hypothetical protein
MWHIPQTVCWSHAPVNAALFAAYTMCMATASPEDTHLPLLPGHQQQQAQGAQGPGLAAAPGSLPCSKHIQADVRGWHMVCATSRVRSHATVTVAWSPKCMYVWLLQDLQALRSLTCPCLFCLVINSQVCNAANTYKYSQEECMCTHGGQAGMCHKAGEHTSASCEQAVPIPSHNHD